jgi:hypothetical protein
MPPTASEHVSIQVFAHSSRVAQNERGLPAWDLSLATNLGDLCLTFVEPV